MWAFGVYQQRLHAIRLSDLAHRKKLSVRGVLGVANVQLDKGPDVGRLVEAVLVERVKQQALHLVGITTLADGFAFALDGVAVVVDAGHELHLGLVLLAHDAQGVGGRRVDDVDVGAAFLHGNELKGGLTVPGRGNNHHRGKAVGSGSWGHGVG